MQANSVKCRLQQVKSGVISGVRVELLLVMDGFKCKRCDATDQ